MRKQFIIILSVVLISGCDLATPFECLDNQVSCDPNSSALMLCRNNQWENTLVSCPRCGDNFDDECYDGYGFSIRFSCQDTIAKPSLCRQSCKDSEAACSLDIPTDFKPLCFVVEDKDNDVSQSMIIKTKGDERIVFESCGNDQTCDPVHNVCVGAEICDICKNDEETDKIGRKITCDGARVSYDYCKTSDMQLASCKSVAECGECINGSQRCIEYDGVAKEETCESGIWQHPNLCGSKSCNDSNECGECLNGAMRCVEYENGHGMLAACQHGRWGEAIECKYENMPAPCANDHKCGDILCVNGYASVKDPSNPTITIKAFCIDSYETLVAFRDAYNNNEKYPPDNNRNAYVLENDIIIPKEEKWIPIGTDSMPFSGMFFGNDKSITLEDGYANDGYYGIFGVVSGKDGSSLAYINHLKIDASIFIESYTKSVGLLAGRVSYAIISDIEYKGRIYYEAQKQINWYPDNAWMNVGGLIGDSTAKITIKNISTSSCEDVYCLTIQTPISKTGGIIGNIISGTASYISHSNIHVNIKTTSKEYNTSYVGGVAGFILYTSRANDYFPHSISDVSVSGLINTSNYSLTGGFVGKGDRMRIVNSHANIELNSTNSYSESKLGGMIGYATDCGIYNSSFEGYLKTSSGYTGGIVGLYTTHSIKKLNESASLAFLYNGRDPASIYHTYAHANIASGANCGGIVGQLSGGARIDNSYYIGELNNSCGGILAELGAREANTPLDYSPPVNHTYSISLNNRTNNIIANRIYQTEYKHPIESSLGNQPISIEHAYFSTNYRNVDENSYYSVEQSSTDTKINGTYGRFEVFEDAEPVIKHYIQKDIDGDANQIIEETPLIQKLGDDFRLSKCTLYLENDDTSSQELIIPVIEGNVPDYCLYYSNPDEEDEGLEENESH